jgi:hypothetical protein
MKSLASLVLAALILTILPRVTPADSLRSTVEFAPTSYTAAEHEGMVTLTLTRAGELRLPVSIWAEVIDGTTYDYQDYGGAEYLVVFGANEATASFAIQITDDQMPESDEFFDVKLEAVNDDAVPGTRDRATVTIPANDHNLVSTVEFAPTSYTVSEGAGTVTLTLERTGGLNNVVSVWGLVYGISTVGSIPVVDSGGVYMATFGVNETTTSLVVPIVDDDDVEGCETFAVAINQVEGGGAAGERDEAAVTIVDDDEPASIVEFDPTSYRVDEGDGMITLTLTRRGNLDEPVSIWADASTGTARLGQDFTGGAMVDFGEHETTASLAIQILDDQELELDETLAVTLAPAAGPEPVAVRPGENRQATVTILDDDQSVSMVEFAPASYRVHEGDGMVTLTLTRRGNLDEPVWANAASGTALLHRDFNGTASMVVFGARETTASFAIQISNDLEVEGSETFTLTLAPVNDDARPGALDGATVTILDDDADPASTVEFAPAGYSVDEEAGLVILTLERTGNLEEAVSIWANAASGTAELGGDFNGAANMVVFGAGEATATFAIQILNDQLPEEDETFTVTLARVNDDAEPGVSAQATVIIDDNSATITTGSGDYWNEGDADAPDNDDNAGDGDNDDTNDADADNGGNGGDSDNPRAD